MKLYNKLFYVFVVMMMVGALFIAGCSSAGKDDQKPKDSGTDNQKPVTFEMVSFLPTNHSLVAVIPKWVELVEEATDGQVSINWKGGPEIIPPLEQFEAVRNGVVDININVSAYYEPVAPELRAFSLSEFNPWEERENGFFDYMAERHNNIGAVYLGRWLGEQSFYFWVNKPLESPDGIKGRSLRTQALYDRFMQELGATPISVDTGEVYTALERSIVDGFGWPILGPRDMGWTETTKYVIDHSFYNQNGTILFNPDSWNEINPELQAKVISATEEFERYMIDYFIEASKTERAKLKDEGVTFIEFSPEDAERFVQTAHEIEWEYLAEKVPELASKLEELSRK